MSMNLKKCVLLASAFAATSIGGVSNVWASGSSSFDVTQQVRKQIKGKVVDANGDPIIGANVLEKGTTNGVITDVDGNFI